MLPSGISMRTGPGTNTGPDGTTRIDRLGGGHGLSARITTSCSSRRPARSRPVSSSHFARADSTGPNGIHCDSNDFRIQPGGSQVRPAICAASGELRLHEQQRAAAGQQLRRRRAQRIQNQPPVGPASHARAGPMQGGSCAASRRVMGHVRADCRSPGRTGRTPPPAPTSRDAPTPRSRQPRRLGPRTVHRLRADVERGDLARRPARMPR